MRVRPFNCRECATIFIIWVFFELQLRFAIVLSTMRPSTGVRSLLFDVWFVSVHYALLRTARDVSRRIPSNI